MAPKRKAQGTPEATASQRRRSTRLSSSTGVKSKYFDDGSDDELSIAEVAPLKPSKSRTKTSAKENLKPSRKSATNKRKKVESEVEEDVYDDDEEATPAEEDDAYNEEVVEEEDDDEEASEADSDAPLKVTYIPLPKLREIGSTPYSDATLHPNTMLFLKDLKANNNRPWLKLNDEEYRRALKDWESYVTTLTARLIDIDPTIPELPNKDVIFRIYRDTRFSKDPTPYKPHFSAAWSRTGRKGPYACYYVHVEPGGNNFIGGGLWNPPGEAVGRLRASIDDRPHRWRRVLGEEGFRSMFFEDGKKKKKEEKQEDEDEACVKKFVERNKKGALKTKPKGFLADHRDIELLKLKNFTISKKLPDSAITARDSQDQISGVFEAMVGFVTHLNGIVMPDPGQDSDSEEGEDDDEDEEEEEGQDEEAEEDDEEEVED